MMMRMMKMMAFQGMTMMMIAITSQQLQSTDAWSAALCSKPRYCTSHLPEYDHYDDDIHDDDDDLHDDDDDNPT